MKNNPIRAGTGKLIWSEDQRPHQQPFITWHIHQLRSIFLHNKNHRTILLSEGGATARYSSAIGRRLLCESDIGAPWWGTSRFPKCIRRREEAAGGCTSVSYLQVVLTWTLKRGVARSWNTKTTERAALIGRKQQTKLHQRWKMKPLQSCKNQQGCRSKTRQTGQHQFHKMIEYDRCVLRCGFIVSVYGHFRSNFISICSI